MSTHPESLLNLPVNNPPTLSPGQDGGATGDRVDPAQKTELTLNPSKEFARKLILEAGITSKGIPFITVAVYVRNRYIGGINSMLSEASYLDITSNSHCHSFLCVDRGPTYQVTEAEVARIRATFPQLRVREGQS